MNYSYIVQSGLSFDEIKSKLSVLLKDEGFGILFDVPISEKIKEKLGKNIGEYNIFGVCNPAIAFDAFAAVEDIGLFLPCNIVVYKKAEGYNIATILPINVMKIINNPVIDNIPKDVEVRLK